MDATAFVVVALLVGIVVAAWIFYPVGVLKGAGGTVDRLVSHSAFTDEARALVRRLEDLVGELEVLLTRGAPNTTAQVADLQQAVAAAQERLLALRTALAGHRTGLRTLAATIGWRQAWIGWRRWLWVDGRVRRAIGKLGDAARLIHAGQLEVADPTTSTSVLTGRLRRVVKRPGVRVEGKSAYISFVAPPNAVPRVVKRETVSGKKRHVVEVPRPERDVNRDYIAVLTDTVRTAVSTSLDAVSGLNGVAISVLESRIHPTRGHAYEACVLSVVVDRRTWTSIVHANVSAENALRNFDLRLRYDDDFRLAEVPSGPAASPATYTDPTDLDPIEFEHVIGDLLREMGFTVTVTKASGDGGIDVDAHNANPVLGGRVLVQCKRYQGNVGASAVRDLYGAVTDARAMKGILVSTGGFTVDAKRFADGKPIELIDGVSLRDLLRRHGLLQGTQRKKTQ